MIVEEETESRNRVLPLITDSGNRQLLVEWIDEHPRYETVSPQGSIDEVAFDVCVLDKAAFEEHFEALQATKMAAAPVLIPYLLLLPEGGSGIVDTDAGQVVDNVVTETIDEIVSMPIQQAELHWRLSALLRLREQSLTLQEQERELERQVDLFEKSQDIANVGAWEYDIDAEEAVWTNEVYRLHALSEDTTPSQELSLRHYHPDDRPVIEDAFETAVEEGEPYDLELRFVDAEGDERWVRTRGEPQYVNGKLTRVRGTIQDITERKERERDLQRLEKAVEASGHAIFITDPDGRFEYVNPAFEEMTGFTQAELVGKTPRVLGSGEMPDGFFDELWNTILSGEVWQDEIVNRRKSGETYTAMQTIAPVTDNGEIRAFVAVQNETTERKQREEELRRRKQAIDAAPVGICIVDPEQEDNQLIYVNDAFVDITGYPRDAVLGKNCRFLQGENTDRDRVARISKAIDAQEPVSVELRNYRKDGTEFWNDLEIAPVRNDADEVVNFIGFHQNITGRKRRQQQLEILGRVLRHNLRNNMNVIRGHAETIYSISSGEVANSAETIVDTSDELVELTEKEQEITALLQEEPEYTTVNVESLLQRVASTLRSEYPDATVTVDCADDGPVQVTTEFRQAIRELATNAITHNDSSSPEVALTATHSDENTRIEVVDNGPEIPEMERTIIVGEEEQTPLYHGSGLGLWLVKLIVSRSGGTMTFEKNSADGNTVGIELLH